MRSPSFLGSTAVVAGIISMSLRMISMSLSMVVASVQPLQAQDPLNVAGKWDGTLSALGRASIQFTLTQEGKAIRGTYDVRGTAGAFYDVRVTGTIEGATLTLATSSGQIRIVGEVSGETISGMLIDNRDYGRQQLQLKKVP